jgi:hypothetical protein
MSIIDDSYILVYRSRLSLEALRKNWIMSEFAHPYVFRRHLDPALKQHPRRHGTDISNGMQRTR